MAVLKMTVPNAEFDRILDGAGETLGYAEQIPDPDGPPGSKKSNVSLQRFVELAMIEVVKDWAASGETQKDQSQRRRQVKRDIEAVDIT